ncbi:CHAD domain-containing protein [Pseudarthrobacter sp. NPDC058362]|uniref:CYTH and CHAD domain-containing protein n=1 Tax=Pseudarthrobacter sp. NPDC058362 TaxID=3346458 RepID=UPI003664A74D
MNFEGMEVEMKYDAGAAARVPGLAELPGVARVASPRVDSLTAVYFDSPGRALAGRGITLRRRTGGTDEGWHLKLAPEQPPGNGADAEPGAPEARRRRELHAPLGRADAVPDALLAHLHVHLRGADLAPLVRLETQRTTHALYGPDGTHLADLADDSVTASLLPAGGGPYQWREWEFELVHGGPDLLGPAADLLAAAGATHTAHGSKLARALAALAEPLPADTKRPPGESTPQLAAGKEAPAAAVVGLYFATHLDKLLGNDPGVRLEEPEAVHNMRSAARRLRSALAAYRKLYSKAPVRRLAEELKWLGGMLGGPRDAEVLRERLDRHAAELPPGKDSAGARERLDRHGAEEFDAGYRRLLLALESGRYFRLLDALEDFRDAPPLRLDGAGTKATRRGRKVSARAVAKAAKRLRRAQDKASGTAAEGDYEEALHRVRKDAKRLRHVAESAEPVRRRARKVAKAAHRQQKVLGDFHDAVIARDLLARMGSDGPYAVLHAREIELMAAAEKKYRKARKKSRRLLHGRIT